MAKVKLFVHVVIKADGSVSSPSFWPWDKPYNDTAIQGGDFNVCVGEAEFDYELPSRDTIDAKALLELHKHRDKLQGEHRNLLTKLQIIENSLLRLGSVDILDRE